MVSTSQVSERRRHGLTSCSERPSMISDTSCSLRAADMESPLPRWPTLLQSKGTQSGPASQQSGMHGQCRSTDLSPQLPQRQHVGRREGPGLPHPQGQPRAKGLGGGTEPPPHRGMPEPRDSRGLSCCFSPKMPQKSPATQIHSQVPALPLWTCASVSSPVMWT